MKKISVILSAVVMALGGCYYDIEEELYPQETNCDSANSTYSVTVTSIMQNYGCTGCHSGGAPSGNISLDGYANVRTVALNGSLYGAINHGAGFSPMPQGGNKMSTCNISKIKAWIDAGAPNN